MTTATNSAAAAAELTGALAAAALISSSRRVAVITHIGPDGDALGSQLALGTALARLGKQVTMACDDGVPPLYAFLPGADAVVRSPQGEFDLVVMVDCGDFARGGQAASAVAVPGRPLLNIDHHATNTRFGTLNWIDLAATSTAEIVLELLDTLRVNVDAQLATCLLTGLITDTQGFRTSNVNPRALSNAARLTAAGAPAAHLAELTLNRRPFAALCLWSRVLGEMRLEPSGLLWAHVTQAMRTACGIPEGGDSGLATFLLGAEEACMTAVFLERADGQVEISFRAKPGFDVSEVATSLGGGGHPPAAGCILRGPLHDIEPRVVAALERALLAQRHAREELRTASESH